MNIQWGTIRDKVISDNINWFAPFNLIIFLLIHLQLVDKKLIEAIFSSEWSPVQMGWYTSCYCSCRSRIG